EWIREWQRSVTPPPPPVTHAMLWCLVWLVPATLVMWLTAPEGIRSPETPLRVLVLPPLLCGLLRGFFARARRAAGARLGFGLAALDTVAMTPFVPWDFRTDWLMQAVVQVWCWLPVGVAAAAFGGWLRRRLHTARERRWSPE